jgi:hypothetical protein
VGVGAITNAGWSPDLRPTEDRLAFSMGVKL